jgi:transposase
MTNPHSTPVAVVWVAIDVAKDRHEVLIELPGSKSRKRFRVQSAAEEFRAVAEFLYSLNLAVRIGFEPPGNFHRALAYVLRCRWTKRARSTASDSLPSHFISRRSLATIRALVPNGCGTYSSSSRHSGA